MVKKHKSRLERKREKESFRQALLYLFLSFLFLFLLVKFGLPGLINLVGFLGDVRTSSQPIEKTDQIPPLPPKMDLLPEATQAEEITISGYAEAGSTVRLFVRGISGNEVIADKEGRFEFKAVHLREGENSFYTTATDKQGNTSDKSETQTIIFDKTAPELNISQPEDGQRFFDTDSPIIIKGQTESEVNLTINDRFVMLKPDGSFEMSFKLEEGDNRIEVVARDEAGNETRRSVTVNYKP